MHSIQEAIQNHLDRYEKEHGPQQWNRALNFGCGMSKMVSTERTQWVNVDKLEDYEFTPTEFDLIVGWHVIEHIEGYELLAVMQELWDRAKPEALAILAVPHGSSDMAWENPTHVRAMFPHSFGFFSQPYYWREDYGYEGDWRVEKVEINVPASKLHDDDLADRVRHERNVAGEMRGYLRCQKPTRLPLRELQDQFTTYLVPEDE